MLVNEEQLDLQEHLGRQDQEAGGESQAVEDRRVRGGLLRLLACHRQGPQDRHQPADGQNGWQAGGRPGPKKICRAGIKLVCIPHILS